MDDEEDADVEQDDLIRINDSHRQYDGPLRKRYFYQMDFTLEFPFNDDTVYIAYSRPYPYSKVLASMFAIEENLTNLPKTNLPNQNVPKDKKGFSVNIVRRNITYERSLLC